MILIGLGSNVGDRQQNIITAIQALSKHTEITIEKVSALYETKPVGVTNQPDFLNGAISIHTTLAPLSLLAVCLDVECQMGRVRHERWGPRNIDIDILSYHSLVIRDEVLQLPHPRLHERAFVLVPLEEIASDVMIHQGATPGELLATMNDRNDVTIYAELDLSAIVR